MVDHLVGYADTKVVCVDLNRRTRRAVPLAAHTHGMNVLRRSTLCGAASDRDRGASATSTHWRYGTASLSSLSSSTSSSAPTTADTAAI